MKNLRNSLIKSYFLENKYESEENNLFQIGIFEYKFI